MEKFDSFCELMKEYIQLFDTLIQIQEDKIEAINKNHITGVESCMNQEQAAVLKMRGLELQRDAVMKELHCEDLTFQQVIEQNSANSASLLPLYQQLSNRLQTFRSISDTAKDLIEVNLHVINSVLEKNGETAHHYSKDGNNEASPKHFTSRFV